MNLLENSRLTIGDYPAPANVRKMEDLAKWHRPGLTLCLQKQDVHLSKFAAVSVSFLERGLPAAVL